MTPEEMARVVLFATALGRMAEARKVNEPIELNAEENSAVVDTIRVLATESKAAR